MGGWLHLAVASSQTALSRHLTIKAPLRGRGCLCWEFKSVFFLSSSILTSMYIIKHNIQTSFETEIGMIEDLHW